MKCFVKKSAFGTIALDRTFQRYIPFPSGIFAEISATSPDNAFAFKSQKQFGFRKLPNVQRRLLARVKRERNLALLGCDVIWPCLFGERMNIGGPWACDTPSLSAGYLFARSSLELYPCALSHTAQIGKVHSCWRDL